MLMIAHKSLDTDHPWLIVTAFSFMTRTSERNNLPINNK